MKGTFQSRTNRDIKLRGILVMQNFPEEINQHKCGIIETGHQQLCHTNVPRYTTNTASMHLKVTKGQYKHIIYI